MSDNTGGVEESLNLSLDQLIERETKKRAPDSFKRVHKEDSRKGLRKSGRRANRDEVSQRESRGHHPHHHHPHNNIRQEFSPVSQQQQREETERRYINPRMILKGDMRGDMKGDMRGGSVLLSSVPVSVSGIPIQAVPRPPPPEMASETPPATRKRDTHTQQQQQQRGRPPRELLTNRSMSQLSCRRNLQNNSVEFVLLGTVIISADLKTGTLTLSSGGFKTLTTRLAINECLSSVGLTVIEGKEDRSEWMVSDSKSYLEVFTDGMTVGSIAGQSKYQLLARGSILEQATQQKIQNALAKRRASVKPRGRTKGLSAPVVSGIISQSLTAPVVSGIISQSLAPMADAAMDDAAQLLLVGIEEEETAEALGEIGPEETETAELLGVNELLLLPPLGEDSNADDMLDIGKEEEGEGAPPPG